MALPLAMAFAIASGAKPEQGIYTAIIAGLLISIFGGSRVQIGGPTGAFIVILFGISQKYGIDGLQIATFMAGIILVIMGIAKLGGIIKYIPNPVIVGFTAGIAVIIWVGAVAGFFRLASNTRRSFSRKSLAFTASLAAFTYRHHRTCTRRTAFNHSHAAHYQTRTRAFSSDGGDHRSASSFPV